MSKKSSIFARKMKLIVPLRLRKFAQTMKKSLIGLLILVFTLPVVAAKRSVEQAAVIAEQFMGAGAHLSAVQRGTAQSSRMRLAHKANMPNSSEPALYIFNSSDNGGFVLVSADDNALTILGYSDRGAFDAEHIPSNVQYMLDYYAESIAMSRTSSFPRASIAPQGTPSTPISPMLEAEGIKWDQREPYNNLCPSDGGGRCATGCVATAGAQLMRYWKWPEQGSGSHSYTWQRCDSITANGECAVTTDTTLSVDFSAAHYDWANMLPSYHRDETQAQQDAVALLMYHVGVSVNMSYASLGSGAGVMLDPWTSYFGYKNTASNIYVGEAELGGITLYEFTKACKKELAAGRPIWLAGGSHAFIGDGIDANGLFHINWGWGGYADGFFAISTFNPDYPGPEGLTAPPQYGGTPIAVIGITPNRATVNVSGVSVTPSVLTLKMRERGEVSAIVAPANATNKAFTWISSDPNIATVSANGTVVGVSAGTAAITAYAFDGGKQASCIVTVTDEIEREEEEDETEYIKLEATSIHVTRATTDDHWNVYAYYNNGSPFMILEPVNDRFDAIAGEYKLDHGVLWDGDLSQEHLTAYSCQLNIICLSEGTDGCNTYHVIAKMECDNLEDYLLDDTAVICAENELGPVPLVDKAGDGEIYRARWFVEGKLYDEITCSQSHVRVPADEPGYCSGGKRFVGWSATQFNETNVAPALVQEGDSVDSANFYAVYADCEGVGEKNEYHLITRLDELTDGNYVIVGNTFDALTCATVSKYYLATDFVMPCNNVIYNPSDSDVWQIEWDEGAIYFDNMTYGKSLRMYQKDSHHNMELAYMDEYGYKPTVTDGHWKFESYECPGWYMMYSVYNGVSEFAALQSSKYTIRLYKQGKGIQYSNYSTSCAPSPKYDITVVPSEHGSVVTSPAGESAAGKTVTVTATPDAHYQLSTLTVTDAEQADVPLTGSGDTRTFIMPDTDVTVTASFVEAQQYTVRFIDKGEVISSEQYYIGETAVKPANPDAGCEEYSFVGWWTAELAADNTASKAWISNFTVNGAQDYYAIYKKTLVEGNAESPVYRKVTSTGDLTNSQYLIVCSSQSVAFNGGLTTLDATNNNISVTIKNDAIDVTNATTAAEFAIAKSGNNYTIRSASNKYIGRSGNTNGMDVSDNAVNNTISFSSGNADIIGAGGAYLRYNKTNDQKRFRYFKSSSYTGQEPIQLFKKMGSLPTEVSYYSSEINCSGASIEEVQGQVTSVQKVLIDGQIYIFRGDKVYTITGQKVE